MINVTNNDNIDYGWQSKLKNKHRKINFNKAHPAQCFIPSAAHMDFRDAMYLTWRPKWEWVVGGGEGSTFKITKCAVKTTSKFTKYYTLCTEHWVIVATGVAICVYKCHVLRQCFAWPKKKKKKTETNSTNLIPMWEYRQWKRVTCNGVC